MRFSIAAKSNRLAFARRVVGCLEPLDITQTLPSVAGQLLAGEHMIDKGIDLRRIHREIDVRTRCVQIWLIASPDTLNFRVDFGREGSGVTFGAKHLDGAMGAVLEIVVPARFYHHGKATVEVVDGSCGIFDFRVGE